MRHGNLGDVDNVSVIGQVPVASGTAGQWAWGAAGSGGSGVGGAGINWFSPSACSTEAVGSATYRNVSGVVGSGLIGGHKFTKTAGVNSITVGIWGRNTVYTSYFRATINGLSGTDAGGVGNSITYSEGGAIDISSLSDGTTYDIIIQEKTTFASACVITTYGIRVR